MAPAADSFDLLVERIADGTPVDWTAAAELCASDDDREQLGNLRLVASLYEVHRTPQPGEAALVGDSLDTTQLTRTMPTMWGDLRVSHLLGRGAFGEVYLARDEQLRRPVALKLLREDLARVPGLEESIIEEGRRLASVDHPNVVTVFGADVRNGRAGFWMEYLPGTTLEDALQARGPYSPSEAARVGRDICHALSAVHGAGLVHRDVKARNIVQDKDGKVVLMDFGAGLEMQRLEDPDTDRIGTSTVPCTPKYSRARRRRWQATSTPSASCCSICSRGVIHTRPRRWILCGWNIARGDVRGSRSCDPTSRRRSSV